MTKIIFFSAANMMSRALSEWFNDETWNVKWDRQKIY